MSGLEDDTELVKQLCRWAKVPPSRLAKDAGLTPTTITRPFNGTATTRISTPTLEKLRAAYPKFDWVRVEAEQGDQRKEDDAVQVERIPTFAGLGGGGTGEGAVETALIPRRLIRDELRAKPADLLVINVRGNSMEPLFRHGDQLIIDRRDRSPTQPGPFALLYDDGYVVKNVAWVDRRTKLRISSSNPEFPPEECDPNEVDIMGRPVWFARRL